MQPSKNLYSTKKFRSALRHFVVGRAAQGIATLGFTLVSVRLLAPSDYGAYMVLLGLIEFCRPLSSLGLLPALQQFLPEMALHATREKLFRFVRWTTFLRFTLLTAFAAGLYIFWEPASAWFGFTSAQTDGSWIACAMVITVLGATFTDHMLEALLEQRFAQVLRALYPLGRLAGLLGVAAAGSVSLQSMLWVDLISSVICLVLAEWALVHQLKGLTPDGTRDFTLKEIASFTWHLSGAQVLNAIATPGFLRILVSRTVGLEAAGYFAFMQQLLTQLNRFLPSLLLANLVRPMLIARNLEGDVRGVATASGLLWKSNVGLVWPMVGVMFVAGDAVVGALSGGRIADGGIPMVWMMLSAASSAQSQIVSMVMQVYRYSSLVRLVSLASLVAPALVWVGCNYGLSGAAAGFAASVWVRSMLGIVLLQQRERQIELDWLGAGSIMAVLLASTACAWFAGRWLDPMLSVAVLLLIYSLGVLVIKPMSRDEYEIIGRVVGGRSRHFAFLARRV